MGMPSSDLVELGKQEEKKRKGDSEREWSEVRSRGRMRLLVSLAASGSLSLCCRRSGFQSLSFSASDEKMMHLAKGVRETAGRLLAI